MDDDRTSGVEAAVFGTADLPTVRAIVDAYVHEHLHGRVARVVFRSGRIDAVWAVELDDGRSVVITAHRPPADLVAQWAVEDAVALLAEAAFPVAEPVAPAAPVGGVVLSAARLLVRGTVGDAREPAVRRSLAGGLAEQVRLLRGDASFVARAGRGPAWCRHQDGPWPEPHDALFDFHRTPPGSSWLDEFAATASRLLATAQHPVVVGHADWCVGNVLVEGSRLVGSFDWQLVTATEAQVAGFAAAGFPDGGSGTPATPDPGGVRAFLEDYAEARGTPFDAEEWRQAAAAASWTMAYNARCQLAFLRGAVPADSPLGRLERHRDAYLGIGR